MSYTCVDCGLTGDLSICYKARKNRCKTCHNKNSNLNRKNRNISKNIVEFKKKFTDDELNSIKSYIIEGQDLKQIEKDFNIKYSFLQRYYKKIFELD